MSRPEPSGDLASEIDALDTMRLDALREHWRRRFKTAPPGCKSAELLRFEIAYRLQAAREGDLDATTRRLLAAQIKTPAVAARGKTAPPQQIGARLVREWRGETHVVEVAAQGFLHAGKSYRSLSAVAREITGAHWSGVRFFAAKAER